jgi:hypothetical protein
MSNYTLEKLDLRLQISFWDQADIIHCLHIPLLKVRYAINIPIKFDEIFIR